MFAMLQGLERRMDLLEQNAGTDPTATSRQIAHQGKELRDILIRELRGLSVAGVEAVAQLCNRLDAKLGAIASFLDR